MAAKVNHITEKEGIEEKGKPSNKPHKKKQKSTAWWRQKEKSRAVIGFIITAIGIYLLLAFISFFINWHIDFDKITNISFYDIASGKTNFKNTTGSIGAAISYYIIYKGFGLASFVFPFIFILIGLRIALGIRIFPLHKSFSISFFILIWLSVTLGFAFHSTNNLSNILGGVFGNQISRYMMVVMGKTGLVILLLALLLVFTTIYMNFPFSQIQNYRRRKQEEKKNKLQPSPSTVPAPSVSYNLHEFAVDEPATTESKIIDKPSPKKAENNSPSNPQPNSKSAREEVEEGTPGAQPKNVDKPVSSHDEVELIIVNSKNKEQTNKEPEITEEKGNPITHYTLDTLYDPTLELSDFKLPTADLLQTYPNENANVYKEEIEDNKKRIVETLNNYQIDIQQIKATIGPAVTLYEIIPAPGIRISKIKNLEDDIALSLSALGIRIIAPIPGKGTIGIEVPNLNPEIVSMRSLITSEKFITTRFDLPIALGKTISNECYIADLSRMPHLLMAGATGQGKSVGLNVIITSLLYKKHPAEVKFILVDPKKVELSLFSKIERHYLAKLPDCEEAIITDIRQVVRTLNSLCIEMDDRYALMKSAQVRTIKEYNHKFIHRRLDPNEGHHYMPYIVLIVDEFADLIMTAGKEIELPLTRLAQLARAIGIHLIIATQRPSVNIITGTIKANFPARIAFRVSSKIDSRTILDTGGADQLVGRGDMLLSLGSDLLRLQCAFVDLSEIESITGYIGSQRGYPEAYALPEYYESEDEIPAITEPGERDELFEEAARIIVIHQQGSTSLLQRKLKLGYNRAGRLIDQLEAAGIVGPFEGSKAREVRIPNEQALEQYLRELNNKQ